VLAAILWLPLTAHCQLESIPALKFLACDLDCHSPGQTSDTGDTGCCALEKVQYKSSQIRVELPSPDLLPLLAILFADPAALLSDDAAMPLTVTPPELPRTWHFLSRAALPPRAPSIAS